MSEEVDLLTVGSYGFTNWPSLPGHQIWISSVRFVLTDLATPPTFEVTVAPAGTAVVRCKGRAIVFGMLTKLTPVTV